MKEKANRWLGWCWSSVIDVVVASVSECVWWWRCVSSGSCFLVWLLLLFNNAKATAFIGWLLLLVVVAIPSDVLRGHPSVRDRFGKVQ